MTARVQSAPATPLALDATTRSDVGKLLLRAVPALSMLTLHGWGKLQVLLAGAAGFPDPLGVGSTVSAGLAVSAEVGAATLLVLGAFTRLATVPLIATMLVAIFAVHAGSPWAARESAAIYLTIFLTVAALGPGRFSLDALWGRRD